MTDDYRTELVTVTSDTVIAQNTDVLGSDFFLKRAANLCRISVASTAVPLVLTPSSGTAITLGTPSAGVVTTYELALDHGRTWNLQSTDAGGVTVYHLCVQEVSA